MALSVTVAVGFRGCVAVSRLCGTSRVKIFACCTRYCSSFVVIYTCTHKMCAAQYRSIHKRHAYHIGPAFGLIWAKLAHPNHLRGLELDIYINVKPPKTAPNRFKPRRARLFSKTRAPSVSLSDRARPTASSCAAWSIENLIPAPHDVYHL